MYGPEDSRDKLFNTLQKSYETGELLDMAPGEQLLDLVYIDDVVNAFIQADHLLRTQSSTSVESNYAVSSSRHISLKDTVCIYGQVTGQSLNIRWGGLPYRSRQVMGSLERLFFAGVEALGGSRNGNPKACCVRIASNLRVKALSC